MEGTSEDQKFMFADDFTIGLSQVPVPVAERIVLTNSALTISFGSLAVNASYAVERTFDLSSNEWVNVDSLTAMGTVMSWAETIRGGWTGAYYRLKTE